MNSIVIPSWSYLLGMQVYKTEKPGTPVHVYNLWYSRSLELDRYTAELQREQKVFRGPDTAEGPTLCLPELAQVSLQKSHSYLNTGETSVYAIQQITRLSLLCHTRKIED